MDDLRGLANDRSDLARRSYEHRLRRKFSAARHSCNTPAPADGLTRRLIDHMDIGLCDPHIPSVGDHPHHALPWLPCAARVLPSDASPDRILTPEVRPRKRLIDDDNRIGLRRVIPVEGAPAKKCCSHGPKIVRTHGVEEPRWGRRLKFVLAFNLDREGGRRSTLKRCPGGVRHTLHTRITPHPAHGPVEQRLLLLRRE